MYRTRVTKVCLSLDTPFGRRSVGALSAWFAQKCALCVLGNGSNSICVMPYMPALAGQPSLHGYYACMVCWVTGAPRRNCRQKYMRPPFLLLEFFCTVGTLHIGFGRCSGIFGSVGLGILARPPVNWPLRFSMLGGGSLMVIWSGGSG